MEILMNVLCPPQLRHNSVTVYPKKTTLKLDRTTLPLKTRRVNWMYHQ